MLACFARSTARGTAASSAGRGSFGNKTIPTHAQECDPVWRADRLGEGARNRSDDRHPEYDDHEIPDCDERRGAGDAAGDPHGPDATPGKHDDGSRDRIERDTRPLRRARAAATPTRATTTAVQAAEEAERAQHRGPKHTGPLGLPDDDGDPRDGGEPEKGTVCTKNAP